MSWKQLESIEQVTAIEQASFSRPQLIFKHSTRCGISAGAQFRLQEGESQLAEQFDLHFLDLLSFRGVSNHIADHFGVRHQSPQVIVVDQGTPRLHLSHGMITVDEILNP